MNINRPIKDALRTRGNLLKQLIACSDLAGGATKSHQQIKLKTCKRNCFISELYSSCCHINSQSADGYLFAVTRRAIVPLGTSGDCSEMCQDLPWRSRLWKIV